MQKVVIDNLSRVIIFNISFCIFLFLFSVFSVFVPEPVTAEVILKEDKITTVSAVVLEVEKAPDQNLPGSSKIVPVQKIKAQITEGTEKGKIVSFENDYIQLKQGDTFYLRSYQYADGGRVVYGMADPDRMNTIYWLLALFLVVTFVFGGKQGIRGFLSLCVGLLLILYILIPGILYGYSPIALSILVSSFIVVVGSYVTHGYNKTTTSAVFGMIATLLCTGLLSFISVHAGKLSGFYSDESVYLNLNTNGTIDFSGLLLGGILIGLLGVLYDAAIGQSVAVEELHKIAPHVSRRKIFERAIRIGREHIGALINTLAIAYVGVSLPLLLLFSTHDTPIIQLINRENFATEIVRTLVGSIGLILAVPITSLISVLVLVPKNTNQRSVSPEKLKEEYHNMLHTGHSHVH